MTFTFNLFDKCNLCCTYCYKNEIAGLNKKKLSPISNDLIFDIISEAFEFLPEIKIQLTGGEPFVEPQKIIDILVFLSKYTDRLKNVTITTNGTLINYDIAKEIKRIFPKTEIDITIDGPLDLHNSTRKSKGNSNPFMDSIKAIKILNSLGIKVMLNSVITKKQLILGAQDYYRFMQSLNVPWIFGKVITTNTNDKISEEDFNSFVMDVLYNWSEDDDSDSNTFIDSMLLYAMGMLPLSNTEQCSLASISFAGEEGFAWPCVKLIPYSKYCLGSYSFDGLKAIINHPLRQEIYDLFTNDNICFHESLVEQDSQQVLSAIADERKKLIEFLKQAI